MILNDIADGILRTVEGVTDTVTSPFQPAAVRLGVTGLSRAGKTVFITSLIANLQDRGRMPQLVGAATGAIETAYLQPQPDDTVPRFDYEAHLGDLTSPTPNWPDSTRAVSQLRLSLKVNPKGLLSGFTGPKTVHLDIVDYPGEWLLDLGLMEKSYAAWSRDVLERLETRSSAEAYRALLAETDASAKHSEPVAKALAQSFTDYLHAARKDGFYDVTPGRFILPGEMEGSPVLTFAPLPELSSPGRRTLYREMERRFEAYKARVVKPFFR
ncbi:MAG: YcjX family protein, partial [Pseudomonadota bacterium]